MTDSVPSSPDRGPDHHDGDGDADLLDLLVPLASRWRTLVALPFIAGAIGYGVSWLVPPVYTARTLMLPPQQQQSGMASALSSLGALAGFAGGQLKSPAEQYVSLMQSDSVTDVLIDKYGLLKEYHAKFRDDARRALAKHSLFTVGKKDGLITIEVEDEDPARAARIANDYVEELRRMTSTLAVSEAQQRRAFFEQQMRQSHDRLVKAQEALQATGINAGALKTEPRSAAEAYARIKEQLASAEVKLESLRATRAEDHPDVIQQRTAVEALRGQLRQQEVSTPDANAPDGYVSRYREFKYQETLFEQVAKQYELARLDEAREGAVIQVVDPARPPERRTRPRRAYFALGAAVAAELLFAAWLVASRRWRQVRQEPSFAQGLAELKRALRGR